MKEQFQRLFSAPVFEGDQEKSWNAILVNTTIIILAFVVVLVIIGNLIGGRTPTSVLILDGVMLLVLFSIRKILLSGRVLLAGAWLIAVAIILIVAASALLGTIRTPSTAFLILVVIIAGLLFGRRGLVLSTTSSSLAVLGLIVAENAGFLPVPDTAVTVTQWVTYTVAFGLTGMLTNFAYQAMQDALERVFAEIAERKRAEEAYENIVNNSLQAYAIYQDERFVFVNPQVEHLTGYSREELYAMPAGKFFSLIIDEDREERTRVFRSRMAGAEFDPQTQFRITRKDGEVRWLVSFTTNITYRGKPALQVAYLDITAQKQAEEQLRKLSRAVEAAPVSIVITDSKGNIEYVNPYFSKLTGYERNEVIGENPRIMQSGNTPHETYTELWETILNGQSWQGEFVNKRKDGSDFTEAALISPIFDKGQRITHFVAIKQDITKQKEATRQLLDTKIELSWSQQIANLGSWELDLNTQSITLSAEHQAMLGLELIAATLPLSEYAAAVHMLEAEIEILQEKVEFAIKNADNENYQDSFEYHATRSNGQERILAARSRYKARGVIRGITQDITEYRQVEEELRVSEANFREVFDNTAHGIFINEITEDGEFRSGMLNKADEILTSIRREDVEGKLLKDLPFPADFKRALQENYNRCIEAGAPIAYEEEFNLPSAGQRFYYTTLAPVRNKTGRFYRIIGSTIEITDRKIMEEREHQQRLLAEALRDSAVALNSSLELDYILDTILENINKVVQFDSMHVTWFEEEYAKVLRWRGYTPEQEKVMLLKFPLSEYPSFLQVFESRQSLVIPDVQESPLWKPSPETEQVRSHLKVPIIVNQQVAGTLNLHSKTPGFYSDRHAQTLKIFADQVGIAVRNSMLFEEVQNLATVDELTGLYNRRGFLEICHREIGRLQRYQRPLSVIFVDIDHFKQFNDRYSYEVGDQVLKSVSQTLKHGVREIDVVGRYGGEESVILLPEIDQKYAIETAERLRMQIERLRVSSDQGELGVTASFGVATLVPKHEKAIVLSEREQEKLLEELIAKAGAALHFAKKEGRNRVIVNE